VTGLYAAFAPKAIEGLTGLSAPGSRGIIEFRAIFGGLFIALGGGATYRMLGLAYLAIGSVWLVAMFVDGSLDRANWISQTVEIIFGVVLAV